MNPSEHGREKDSASRTESELQYRQLFESNPHPMWIFDRETLRFLAVNAAAVFYYGFTREEFLGMTLKDIRPEEEIDRLLADVQLGHIGHDVGGIWKHKRKDGTVFDVEIISHDLIWLTKPAKLVLAMDVTQRKEAEERIRRLTRMYATLSQVNQTIVRTKDRDNLFQSICHVAVKFGQFRIAWIGFAEPEKDDVNLAAYEACDARSQLPATDSKHALLSHEPLADALRRGQIILYDDIREADELDEWRQAALGCGCRSAAVVPIRSKGNVIGTLNLYAATTIHFRDDEERALLEEIGSDISFALDTLDAEAEYKRTLEAHARLEEQLFQARKLESIGRLAGGVAHDFNNLLGVIIGYCELLLMKMSADDPLRDKLQEIRSAGGRAAELTHQLLAFSRKQIIEPKVFDLNVAVTDLSRMLDRIIGEDIRLSVLPNDEQVLVRADRSQIEQVIMNLIVNARDAMPSGGRLTIETANVDLDDSYAREHFPVSPGPYVMLAVSDTGVGMDAETQKYIFEPFFTTKEKGKGTGLGLSTVYGIVQQSGGYIWVYSEVNRGTTFKVYFPRVEAVEGASPAVKTEEPLEGAETILVVEDADGIRKLAEECLKSKGYRVIAVKNGREALLYIDQSAGNIHLLLTDVVLPDISGPQLAERLVSKHPEMRVLYMSGYTDDAIVHQGMLDPGIAFLQKPFTVNGLWRKVRSVLDADGSEN